MTAQQVEEPVRLGFLVPERNVACETEFPRYAPDGITCHFSRLPRGGAELTADSLLAMMDAVDSQSKLLADIGIRVIMCACTSGSFLAGAEKAGDLGERVRAATGIPGITTSQAVVEALRGLGAIRVFMLTPYPEEITEAEVRFFQSFGFEIPDWDTFGCARSEEIRRISAEEVRDRVMRNRAAVDAADAVFVSCTALHTMEVLDEIEDAVGKPVVSSNSATLWRALRAAGLPLEGLGAGRLFATGMARPTARELLEAGI